MRIALLCSGQSGQRRDMLNELLIAPECDEVRNAASEVLGQDVAKWWHALDEEAIFHNANAQFSIAFYQIATWTRIKALLPDISLVAGYSLGELLAYFIAGALDATDTFRLVKCRARLMDEASIGVKGNCMVLWRGRVSPATLAARDLAIAYYGLDVAIVRRTGEEVLAGPSDAIARFVAEFKSINPNIVRLPVNVPAHSHYLATAAASFRDVLLKSSIVAPQVAVLSSVNATPVKSRLDAISTLSRQVSSTIRWNGCMDALAESGIKAAIEIGPGNDLAKLIEAAHPEIRARAVGDFAHYQALTDWLSYQ